MDKINPEMVKPVITGTETADKTGGDYRRTSGKSSRKKELFKDKAFRNTCLAAFFIPLFLMIGVFSKIGIYPFGDFVYLRCDSWHQYAPFFGELWEKMRNFESLTYTWNIGMGTNFSAIIPYYLASPLNWIIVLFPKKDVLEVISYIIAFKISCSSLTFNIYLTKHYKKTSMMTVAFGLLYAMSGYMAGYCWNNMWLDCIIMLPVIFLGLEKLVYEKKSMLYCISLAYAIFSNYYIGIILCISSVVYFIVLIVLYNVKMDTMAQMANVKIDNSELSDKSALNAGISDTSANDAKTAGVPDADSVAADAPADTNHLTIKKLIGIAVRFGIHSAVAGMAAAVMILPEAYALSLSASGDSSFPTALKEYYPLLETLARHMILVPTSISGYLPNLYSGVLVFLLVPLFIMDKKINLKEKITKVILIVFFILSFDLNYPDYIWHGFHFPNCLPSRQSFVYTFFLLTMCFEALRDIKELSVKQICTAFGISSVFFIYADANMTENYDFTIILGTAAFAFAYMLFMIIYKQNRKKSAVAFVAFLLLCAELTINIYDSIKLGAASRSGYLLDNNGVETDVAYTEKNDPDEFYRVEKAAGWRSRDDGAWSDYRSCSVFTSITNYGLECLFGDLGLLKGGNSYGYGGATPFTSSLLGVKYLISNATMAENPLLTYVTGNDGELMYRNEAVLPVGFVIGSKDFFTWPAGYNSIDAQNELINNLVGVSDTFTFMGELNADNCDIVPTADQYIFVISKNNSDCNTLYADINGTKTTFNYLDTDNHICDLGYVHLGDTITVTGSATPDILVYSMDVDKLKSVTDALGKNGLNVTSFTDTSIEGTLTSSINGCMLLTIPYDKGWSVYIDGKKVNTYAVKDAFIGVDVTAGTYDVKIEYTPVGLHAGIIISAISVILIALLGLADRLKRKNKKKYDMLPAAIRYIE